MKCTIEWLGFIEQIDLSWVRVGFLNELNAVVELNVVWEDIDIDFAEKSVSWSRMAQDLLLIWWTEGRMSFDRQLGILIACQGVQTK